MRPIHLSGLTVSIMVPTYVSGRVLRLPLGATAPVCQQSRAASLGTGPVQGQAGGRPPSSSTSSLLSLPTPPPPSEVGKPGRELGLWGGGRSPLFVEHLLYPAEVSPTALLEAEMAHGKLRAPRFLLRLPWCQAHPGLD